MYDTIIIGGGFGGLTCAVTLAKAGQRVCVLEKSNVLGGAFQTFYRKGVKLDTGFHHVGGVAKGEMMYPMLKAFGLNDLPWVRLDEEFIEAHIDGKTYNLCCGYDRFAESLTKQFPSEESGINALIDTMRCVADHIYQTVDLTSEYENKLMQVPARAWIEEHFNDPQLKKLLCAQAVTTDLTPELPLYSFTQTLNSFVQHTYRVEGGGETIINRLRHNIEELGGEVRTGCGVVEMLDDSNGHIVAVRCSDGNKYAAHNFIAAIHPAISVALMPECKQIRSIYRRRFNRMPNSRGIFTVQIVLKPEKVRYRNQIISILGSSDPWVTDYSQASKVENLLIHFNIPQHRGDYASADTEPCSQGKSFINDFADNIDIMTPMDFSAVAPWCNSHVGHRPDDYKAFKEAKARECIDIATQYLPELKDNISAIYTSTPLTYRDYTGTVDGSAFGIRKASTAIAGGMLSPMTPFQNLFLAGQSLMLHGMLGVGMTSILVTNIIKRNFF